MKRYSLINTWREEYVRPRGRVFFALRGTESTLPPGRMFVVVKYRPGIVGEDDRIDAGIKKTPVHQTILPEV